MRSDHDNALKYGETGRRIPGQGQRSQAIAGLHLPARAGSTSASARSTRCATTTIGRGRLVRQGHSAAGTRVARGTRRRSGPPRRGVRQHGRFLLGGRPAGEGRRADARRASSGWSRPSSRARSTAPSLAVPYNNLAAMHRKLGADRQGRPLPGNGQPGEEGEAEVAASERRATRPERMDEADGVTPIFRLSPFLFFDTRLAHAR